MTGIEYHYILTLTHPTQLGSGTWTGEGAITVTTETRQGVLNQLWRQASERHGIPAEANVLFFSLEPNVLGGGR